MGSSPPSPPTDELHLYSTVIFEALHCAEFVNVTVVAGVVNTNDTSFEDLETVPSFAFVIVVLSAETYLDSEQVIVILVIFPAEELTTNLFEV